MKPEQVISETWNIVSQVMPNANWKLFLFGSRAKGTNKEFSDFDFIIQCNEPLPHSLLIQIKANLSKLKTLYSIDVVDFLGLETPARLLIAQHMKEINHGKVRNH